MFIFINCITNLWGILFLEMSKATSPSHPSVLPWDFQRHNNGQKRLQNGRNGSKFLLGHVSWFIQKYALDDPKPPRDLVGPLMTRQGSQASSGEGRQSRTASSPQVVRWQGSRGTSSEEGKGSCTHWDKFYWKLGKNITQTPKQLPRGKEGVVECVLTGFKNQGKDC